MFLRNHPTAANFLTLGATETGRKAKLGDAEKFETGARPHIIAADMTLRDAIDAVTRLAQDPTRTEVQRHGAAKIVADRTIDALTKQKTALAERGEYLMQSAVDEAYSNFAKINNDSQQASEIRALVRELSQSKDGTTGIKISQMVKESPRIAAVIASSERALMGMTADQHEKYHELALTTHNPEAMEKLSQGNELAELAAKYDRAINDVRDSFYDPALAEQASKRVEI